MLRHQQGRCHARDEVRAPRHRLPSSSHVSNRRLFVDPVPSHTVPDPPPNPDAPSHALTLTSHTLHTSPTIHSWYHDQILEFYKPEGPPKLLFYYQVPEVKNIDGEFIPKAGEPPKLFVTDGDVEIGRAHV